MPPSNVQASGYMRRTTTIETREYPALRWIAAGIRYVLGFTFLWAFVDKLFGLGYATKVASAMVNGGSPTKGFLGNSKSWLSGFYHAIAGNVVTDYLFMAALLLIGLALVLGIGMRVAGISGALLMLLMYTAGTLGVPATSNPAVDDHIVYALVFAAFAIYPMAGDTLGFGRMWKSLPIVQKQKWLE